MADDMSKPGHLASFLKRVLFQLCTYSLVDFVIRDVEHIPEAPGFKGLYLFTVSVSTRRVNVSHP